MQSPTRHVLGRAIGLGILAVSTTTALAQVELATIAPDDLTMSSELGWSVDADGGLALAGAFRNEGTGTAAVLDLASHTRLFVLRPKKGHVNAFFGWDVGLSGQLAVVGAPYNKKGDTLDAGAMYVFDVTTGTQQAKLTASDAQQGDRLGWSVAIDGNRALAGAPYADAAYLFDVTTGQELAKLEPSGKVLAGSFGLSVDLHGDRAVVGALYKAAYVFDLTTGQELYKLKEAVVPADKYGWSVAIDDSYVLVSAYEDDDLGPASGSVYVYEAATGKRLAKLLASDGATDDRFGFSLDLDGAQAAIGAPRSGNVGAAYAFDLTTFQERFKLTAADAQDLDLFASDVALAGDHMVVGASREDDVVYDGGAVHDFLLEPAVGDPYCSPNTTNSTGVSGAMHVAGSQVAADGDLRLFATRLPEGEFGMFLASRDQAFVPGAGGSIGNLCLGGKIARFSDQVGQVVGGVYRISVDLVHVPEPPTFDHAVVAGETWNWQCWYRDQGKSNFTDAVEVMFL